MIVFLIFLNTVSGCLKLSKVKGLINEMWSFYIHYLRQEVVLLIRFVDIGGIVDHHCLNFLFNNKVLNKLFIIVLE
jgi:hypothetical protein